ncbi:jg23494, partial [Pararge aegeria aegeria]
DKGDVCQGQRSATYGLICFMLRAVLCRCPQRALGVPGELVFVPVLGAGPARPRAAARPRLASRTKRHFLDSN